MTHREKFKEEIFEIACEGDTVAVDKKTNRPCYCGRTRCCNCLFNADVKRCDISLANWLDEEYEDTCEFEKDELVEVSDDGKLWCLRYFSHIDENARSGKYRIWNFGLTSKEGLTTSGCRYCRKYGTLGGVTDGNKI